MTGGLDEIKKEAARHAENVQKAARAYGESDQGLADKFGQHQFDKNGNPIKGAPGSAPGSAAAGSAMPGSAAPGSSGGMGGMDQMGQLMQMPMQMAEQLGQLPMSMMGMAGSLPQMMMQSMQQFGKMSGGQNKDGADHPGDQPNDDKPADDKAADDKAAGDKAAGQPGAAAEAKPETAPAPVHQGAGPGRHRLDDIPEQASPPSGPPIQPPAPTRRSETSPEINL